MSKELQSGNIVPGLARISEILPEIGEAAYSWDLQTDQIKWSPDAARILMIDDLNRISCGKNYNALIDPASNTDRFNMNFETATPTEQVAYRIKYCLSGNNGNNSEKIWVEDRGVFYRDQNGKPKSAHGLIHVINDKVKEENRLKFLSDHDELTGLVNRNRLMADLNKTIEKAKQQHRSSAFLILAIDNLAIINESCGFNIGDEVIASIATKLKSRIRGSDQIGRYSSNKFGVIVERCSSNELDMAANRLIQVLKDEEIQTVSSMVSATVSGGGVLIPAHASTIQQAVSSCLDSLDQAKRDRQNNFIAFKPSVKRTNNRSRNMMLMDDVISALNDKRMLLALQPIVNSTNLKPEFHECLLRMRNANGEVISAAQFIPVAEQLGVCRLLDHRALELTIELMRARPNLSISINVSGRTATDRSWLDNLKALTFNDCSLTRRLTVEITETSAIQDINACITFVDTLKGLGCRVAIDDFGAGYSSFKILKNLGVDILKIDGSYVSNIIESSDDKIFMKTLIDLAENFGLSTVAEWVGDEPTARYLKKAGINYLQGYFYGKPELVETFTIEPPISITG